MSVRNPAGPIRQAHLWIFSSGVAKKKDLSQHLKKLAKFIEKKSPELKQLRSNCEIDLFCGFASESGQGGFILEPDLLKQLIIFPVDIVIDLYPPSQKSRVKVS